MSLANTATGGIRFAAYLRTSTEDLQSPEESRRWQLARCESLIVGHGTIVCAFHDIGQSRSLPWKRRPEATALLAEVAATKTRSFDAIVVAEPARAFYGGQFSEVFPVLTHYGVDLWLPETGGRIDPESEAHDLVMMLFGGMSKGERRRIQVRVRTAMRAQAAEGRWLGGRVQYGYLTEAYEPHPNQAKAKEGHQLKRLVVDPVAGPVVQRIFREYLGGKGMRRLADELTREGVPSPTAHNPEPNRHHKGAYGAWGPTGLRAILTNPVYTGFKVYGRQKKVEVLVDPTDPSLGYVGRMRWTDPSEWVWPPEPTHEALIPMETFQAVQKRLVSRRGGRGPREMAKGRRPYALRGLLCCAACGRRMEGTFIDGHHYYRCRLSGPEYARNAALERTHPKSSYLREDRIVPAVNGWLAQHLDPKNREASARALLADIEETTLDPAREAQADLWGRRLAAANAKVARWAEALESGGQPPAVAAQRMREAEEQAVEAERELARLEPPEALDVDEIVALLGKLSRYVAKLRKADPKVLAEAYAKLGLRVDWAPREDVARVEIAPSSPIGRGARGI